jgi:hypothetical protein
LPYIGGNFAKEYIIPNYVGESLAALIPSSLSLLQGLGQNPGCHNVTKDDNTTELQPLPIVPNFSAQVYFILMFLLLCISTLGFSLLHFSPIARRARKQLNPSAQINNEGMHKRAVMRTNKISQMSDHDETKNNNNNNNTHNKTLELEIEENPNDSATSLTSLTPLRDSQQPPASFLDRNEKTILLSMILGVSFVICYFSFRTVYVKSDLLTADLTI